ncbi:MAG: DUF1080 domain-containing protein [Planctomycetes bacterium]|nr:DUF1080 domain-containing protein [Planctomycetota bacterium]
MQTTLACSVRLALLLTALACALPGQRAGSATPPPKPQEKAPGYTDTPLLPGQKWRVHDAARPRPAVVTPATPSAGERVGHAPSDAVVLFDGKDLAAWTGRGDNAGWAVRDGFFEVKRGAGDIRTRQEFGDCQLHLEWCAPDPPRGKSQGRGNSGVFLFGMYEVQILDSFGNATYADGQAAALYGQTPPLVNASRKPGEWQTYDIVFTAPRFKDGKLVSPAYATVLHNGVLVQNHQVLLGRTSHKRVARYAPHGPKGSIKLQDHGDPVRFRNIWVRELGKPAEEARRGVVR